MNELGVDGRARGVHYSAKAPLDNHGITTIYETVGNDSKIANISQNSLKYAFDNRLRTDVGISIGVAQAFWFSPFDPRIERIQHCLYVTVRKCLVDSPHDFRIRIHIHPEFRRCRRVRITFRLNRGGLGSQLSPNLRELRSLPNHANPRRRTFARLSPGLTIFQRPRPRRGRSRERQAFAQCFALEQFRDDVPRTSVSANVVDRRDVRMARRSQFTAGVVDTIRVAESPNHPSTAPPVFRTTARG